MSQPLNIVSLCTGGAGLDLGVELAIERARIVCMVEREAFAVAHLVSAMQQGLLAQAPIWSDARTFNGRAWRGAVDGVIGGIPCQPHSLAGKKLGQHDERDLWSADRRIIVQTGAWFALIENVAGMLSAGDDEIAGAERVHRDLCKLGFEVEGGLFTAEEAGDTQAGERIFILGVASTDRARLEGGERFRASGSVTEFRRARVVSEALAAADGCGRERREKSHIGTIEPGQQASRRGDVERCDPPVFPPFPEDTDGWRTALDRAPELEPAFRRVADGLASRLDIARVDRLRMLGNGVVPLQAAYAIRTLVTRLAARGSAGAARLVRMMEEVA